MTAACTDVRRRLEARVGTAQRDWLDGSLARLDVEPTAIREIFPAVGRHVGRGFLDPEASGDDPFAWTLDDAARLVLLVALGGQAGGELGALYRHGDTAERRAVLRAIGAGVAPGDAALALAQDALRSNDPRLIAAALGPVAVAALPAPALEQAVLKCVAMDLALSKVEGLAARITPRLSAQLAAYAHERIAAGRDVPPQVWPLIDQHPPGPQLVAIYAERSHADPDRRAAARRALAERGARQDGGEQ